MRALRSPLDPERRASLLILVLARWFLLVAAVVAQDYRPDSGPIAFTGINLAILAVAVLNGWLHRQLRRAAPVYAGVAVFSSVCDVAGITLAVMLVDGFRSSAYILYYPALLAFGLAFPGRWGVLFTAATAAGYALVCQLAHAAFHAGAALDQKVMFLRLATMAASVLVANLIVKIERERRLAAVAAEAERAEEVLALEKRALEQEHAARAERIRLSREVHDGISQSVYMLTLGLETAAELQAREPGDARLGERLGALVRLAKGTLLETRNLLFDLEGVMAGQTSLAALAKNQAQEFSAVTGIPVAVVMEGEERLLAPAVVGDVYRVLQEGLANIYKHAQARAATLCLNYGPDTLTLRIADEGAGFDATTPAGRGHGLRNMRERAARHGGCLELDAVPGRGTALTVTIPYGERRHAADSGDAG